jgi:DNA end-binding protein Ku
MARAIWSGSISFGLVSVPVRMFSAVEEHKLQFHYVHAPDGSRIGYEKICKAEEKPVPDEEIVKAYEYEKGEYVYLADEDFEAAQVEGGRTIDIQAFVPHDEIDPIFFEQTYYLGPAEDGEKVYALLARAMDDSGLAAVATFVMRDRQYLACLRIREGVITLERMHFADEIRDASELAPKRVRVDKKELAMAAQLVEQFSGKFEPESFRDTYSDTLRKIIEAKRKGEEIHVPEKPQPEAPADLMAALRASVEAAQKERKSAKGRKRRTKAA